ncbi:hypothetical protein PCL_11321 [Purpureocillium lilacinum]|uniref:Uncharacterized protein n=1 Tax=Purpureocillium lilacinum TaxID=33203 RepID=A0A2U3DPT1_PURLI|nr:hypothetical protein PCL_11321 [Purpureocillium lilacinum]
MDEFIDFSQIACGAFPSSSLPFARSSLESLQKRYPNAHIPVPETIERWLDYTSRISNSRPANFLPALLNVASGGGLDKEIAEDYLQLLRQDSNHAEIFPIRELRVGGSIGARDGLQRPAVIPYCDDVGWAFAVAYPDVIHWYDSRSRDVPVVSASGARKVVANWTGPKCDDEDSGILMLLGIRCIRKGSAHRSQRIAEEMLSSFRARVFVELLCRKLNPNDQDFERLLADERAEQSLFFDDAIHGMDADTRYRTAAAITPPDSNASDVIADPATLGLTPEQSPRAETTGNPRHEARTSSNVRPRQLYADNRRCILEHLSEAVLASRSVGMSSSTSLAILWHSVQRGTLGSVFHERHHAVLFYEKMICLDDDGAIVRALKHQVDMQCIRNMRTVQSQCKFWYDLCNLWEGEEGKYTLLLSLPGTPSIRSLRGAEKRQIITEIQSRLENESDPLKQWLSQARGLCAAIESQQLPDENLMIDLYHLRRHETIGDNEFKAYTSLDPRFKLPLPRAQPGGRSNAI